MKKKNRLDQTVEAFGCNESLNCSPVTSGISICCYFASNKSTC